MTVRKLFFYILLLGYAGYPKTNLVHILADHFRLGSRVFGTLWKLAVITATVAICACLIYLWRVVLATEPPVYPVNVQPKTAKSNTLEKENTELAEAISMWEQKIHLQEAKRESNIHSAEALKLKSEDANGQLEELRAWRSNICELEAMKKDLEDIHNALSSTKAIREETAKRLKERGDVPDKFYEERKMATAKNLDMTNCELVAMKNQMATAEENLKIATRDIDKCKQEIEQTREELQKAEFTFTHQIAVNEKNAQDNWIKTRIWERKMAEQSREVTRLKHRLDVMEGKRLLEGYRRWRPMPGSPEMQNPARREPLVEADGTPMSHNYKQSTNNAEKDKGSVDPWRPPPSTGRFCTPYYRGHPLIWAHPPPVPGSGPPQTPPPAPLGPFSDPHVASVSNNNTDCTKRITEDKGSVDPWRPPPSTGRFCTPYYRGHPLIWAHPPPVPGSGPPQTPPPAPLGPFSDPHVASVSNNNTDCTKRITEDKGSVDPWRPPPSTGRFCTPYYRGHPLIWAHPPPVPGSGPPQTPPPAPLGPFSDPHVASVSNNNTDCTKRITEDKGSVDPWRPPPSTGRFCTPYYRGHPLIWAHPPPVPGSGPPQTPPPAPLGPFSDPHVASVSNNNTDCTKRITEDKGSVDPWRPPPSTGRFCTPYYRGHPLIWAHPPPVPGSGPPQTPPPAPLGPFSDPHVASVSNNNTDCTKRITEDKGSVDPWRPPPSTGRFCTPYYRGHPLIWAHPPPVPGPFSDPHVASVSNNNTDCTKRITEDKGSVDPWRPPPSTGRFCTPYYRGHPLIWAHPPPVPGSGPPQTPPPAPLGPFSDPHVASVSNNNTDCTKRITEDKGSVDPWRPPPSTGRFCTPYYRGHPLIWAHPPPVPGSGPPQTPPPAPLGPFSDPHVASVSNNNTDSTKRTTKDKAIMYARGPGPSPGSPCRLSPMDHPSPPVTGDGPPPPPPPAPPRTKFGLRLRKFPRNLLRFCLCSCCVSSNTSSRRSSQSLRRMRTSWTLNYDQ
ncbi:extensin-like isoform X5 [Felis catus]|uniref:extensin-like isoform X5 n=1 Tax=Felis catus TaxID=9685 RepID=UPI001D1994FD|nr:extensin-like isoform X5 [Felis catus]